MALAVRNSPAPPTVTVKPNYGMQGSTANPQQTSVAPIQGSSPRLQVTANPQPAAVFNQQVPARLTAGTIDGGPGSMVAPVDTYLTDLQKYLKSLYAPAPVARAATYDVAGANARARASAEASQNPLYSKYLNEFLDNARLQQQQEQQKAQMAKDAIDKTLGRTLEDSATNKTRTAEDVTQNMDAINLAADNAQTDQGTQFAIQRIEEARNTAKSGLTGGIGAQQAEGSQILRVTSEGRQMANFDTKKMEQQIFKARTFEDLAKVDLRAGEDATTGKAKVDFDLGAYISQFGVGADINSSGYNVKQFANKNEELRQSAIADATRDYSSQYFNQFIAGLSDPATILATRNKYGGAY